jgi:hypothetical protein
MLIFYVVFLTLATLLAYLAINIAMLFNFQPKSTTFPITPQVNLKDYLAPL